MRIIKTIIEKRKRTANTIEFWRDKGAKIGRNCFIHPSANLSSEPYLIEIGDHVRINTGVIIVTHDGGGGYGHCVDLMNRLMMRTYLAVLKSEIMFTLDQKV